MSYLKLLQETTREEAAVQKQDSGSSYELNEINELSKAEALKSTSAEITAAMQLLNLAGVRIIRSGRSFQVGVWEDLDTPELRAALRVTGLDVHPIVRLEGPDVPLRYKVRSCPDRNPAESFERWQARALAEARRRWGWNAQLPPSPSSQTT